MKLKLFIYLCNIVDPCPDGYVHKKGDISGASLQGDIKATLEECADKCTANSSCNSFEHKENVCNLNKESEPNGPVYQDFIFCKKEGKLSQIFHTI